MLPQGSVLTELITCSACTAQHSTAQQAIMVVRKSNAQHSTQYDDGMIKLLLAHSLLALRKLHVHCFAYATVPHMQTAIPR
jgi:hypothetical protein